jgi:hypothetical protein
MESIDKLTLELLTNKSHYKKYLEKDDPTECKKQKEYLANLKKNKSKILKITNQFLENPEVQFNTEMNDMFKIFAKTMFKYIELKDIERENLYYDGDEKDDIEYEDEILFAGVNSDSDSELNNSELVISDKKNSIIDAFSLEQNIPRIEPIQSFWGKTICKTDK